MIPMQKKIITLQDLSCTGRCSATVALPVLSALGVETAFVPTGIYSTHTGGFGKPYKMDCTKHMIPILEHWKDQGIRADAVYAGYLADAAQMEIVSRFSKELGGGRLYLDPVMGDHGRLYSGFDQSYLTCMKKFAASAFMIFPNLTEACALLDLPFSNQKSKQELFDLLDGLQKLGPKQVLVTGVESEDGKQIGNCYADPSKKIMIWNPKTEGHFHGTGDLFASTVIGCLIQGKHIREAVDLAARFVTASIQQTRKTAFQERDGVRFELCLSMLTETVRKEG